MYAELHAHSAYSFLDGASSPEELAAAAAVHGYGAVALTDHDGLWGAMEFAHACKGLGVKAITGAEVTLDDGSHLTLLAENRTGYSNLCRLLTRGARGTRASNPRERTPPHVDARAGRAPRGGHRVPVRLRARRGAAAATRRLDWLRRVRRASASASSCSARSGAATARATARSRSSPSGSACRAWRPATSTPTTPTAPACRTRSSPCACSRRSTRPSPSGAATASSVMAPPAEMAARFADHPDAVAETARLAERIEFDLTRDLGYRYPGSEDPDADRKLAELCRARLDERYPGAARATARRRTAWRRSCA